MRCTGLGKAFQRGLQIALGVDQEVGGGDDGVALGKTFADFDVAVAAPPGLDLARLEAALALVDQHGLPAAGVQHRALGDAEHRRRRSRVNLGIDIHVVDQQQFRIG